MNRPLLGMKCVAAGLMLMLCGCGGGRGYDGPTRYPVSGTVTVNDKPLSEGTITFVPASQEGRSASGAIENGAYKIDEERGPVEGTYRVKILGYEVVREAQDEDSGPATRQILPDEYNESTTLKAEITAGENQHDFDIQL